MSRSAAASTIVRIGSALLLVACASRPQANATATPDAASGAGAATESSAPAKAGKPTSPRRLDRTRPDLQVDGPVRGSTERSQRFLEITVDIDETGRPDMSTLRLTGAGTAENRNAVTTWISSGVYEPARDGVGRAVRGQYRIRVLLGG